MTRDDHETCDELINDSILALDQLIRPGNQSVLWPPPVTSTQHVVLREVRMWVSVNSASDLHIPLCPSQIHTGAFWCALSSFHLSIVMHYFLWWYCLICHIKKKLWMLWNYAQYVKYRDVCQTVLIDLKKSQICPIWGLIESFSMPNLTSLVKYGL